MNNLCDGCRCNSWLCRANTNPCCADCQCRKRIDMLITEQKLNTRPASIPHNLPVKPETATWYLAFGKPPHTKVIFCTGGQKGSVSREWSKEDAESFNEMLEARSKYNSFYPRRT